jgi:hypothetical protein
MLIDNPSRQTNKLFQVSCTELPRKERPTFKNDGSDLIQKLAINTPAISTQKTLNTQGRVYYRSYIAGFEGA